MDLALVDLYGGNGSAGGRNYPEYQDRAGRIANYIHSFTISTIWHTDFGMTTFVIYFIFVGIQLALKGKNWLILLQAPISFVFQHVAECFWRSAGYQV